MKALEEQIREALRAVVDPELGVNVIELGMIRNISSIGDAFTIELALTTIACPLRSQIQSQVRQKVAELAPEAQVSFQVVEMEAPAKAEAMRIARANASRAAPLNTIPPNARVIAISSGKGGVGKSTVTASLAIALAEQGYVVGVLDADIWGFSIPNLLGIDEAVSAKGSSEDWEIEPIGVKIGSGEVRVISMGFLSRDPTTAIMWRGLVLNRAFQHFIEDTDWSGVDYLLIDMPPGTGDIQMGLSRMLPAAQVLIVTTPNDNAITVALRMVDMARKGNLAVVGVLENMSYFVCEHGLKHFLFGTGRTEKFAQEVGLNVLGQIPLAEHELDASQNLRERFAASIPAADVVALRSFAERLSEEIAPVITMQSCTSRIAAIFDGLEAGISTRTE